MVISPPFGMLATKAWLLSSLDNYMKLANFTLQCQLNKVFLRTYSHNLCYVAVALKELLYTKDSYICEKNQ